MLRPVRESDLSGETLYGNDFDGPELRSWVADEERGYFTLHESKHPGDTVAGDHCAMNFDQASVLRDRFYPVVLALGCADGTDLMGLELDAGRIIAIEPARDWWRDKIGTIPAEYRAPSVTGEIDLPDESVDLVISLGVLHHVANVEFVIGELCRVLKPGGRMMIREPMVSMGDFRKPRVGLTAHERGIPRKLMRDFHRRAGLSIKIERPCSSKLVLTSLQKVGVMPYRHRMGVALDSLVSRLTAPLTPYWRPKPWHKLGPNSLLVISEKT